MRTAIALAVVLAAVNVLACLRLIPPSNAAFQYSFDTGVPMTEVETGAHWWALIVAFPIAEWAVLVHPARVSQLALVVSAVLNGCTWGAGVLWLVGAVRRRLHRHVLV